MGRSGFFDDQSVEREFEQAIPRREESEYLVEHFGRALLRCAERDRGRNDRSEVVWGEFHGLNPQLERGHRAGFASVGHRELPICFGRLTTSL